MYMEDTYQEIQDLYDRIWRLEEKLETSKWEKTELERELKEYKERVKSILD